MDKVNDDLGWQRPGATNSKFHYYTAKDGQGYQRSLCGRYLVMNDLVIEPDTDPPNHESCKKCSQLWEKTYGTIRP